MRSQSGAQGEAADATGQAAVVSAGEASAAELVESALKRIAQLNPSLNAVVTVLDGSADFAAASSQQGLLAGVPVLVKDSCATAGDPTYHGMAALRDAGWRPAYDDDVARRLRAAGAVICGKTNMSELGHSVTTEPVAFGATRNPWDETRSPGGSSGGAAAAVAAGMVAVAHGSDAAGSVRVPAAMCGIVGLKPSRGRVSPAPRGDPFRGLSTSGVLARTVRDAARVLDAIAGSGPDDADHCAPPPRPYVTEIQAEPPSFRIGVLDEIPGRRKPLHRDCRAAVRAAADLLADLGHTVVEDSPAALHDEVYATQGPKPYWASYASQVADVGEILGRQLGPDDVEPLTWAFAERGRQLDARAYLRAVEAMQSFSRRVAQWFDDGFDVLLLATTSEPAPALGEWVSTASDPLRAARRGMATTQLNSWVNHTGQPAMSLPLARGTTGLPIGVQIVAEHGREDILLCLGRQLELEAPWAGRAPEPARPAVPR